jgi:transcriptional regulator GlxA family with amidase domain
MTAREVPLRLRKAIEWVEADPARAWTVREIAAACGVPPRTLQRQFRRYMGQMLMAFVRDLRFNNARVEILRSCGAETVTEIAVRCGFTHLGRFAVSYRTRYGESPSATLRRHQNTSTGGDTRPAPLL